VKKVKLIWDFRGTDTQKMAEHYNKHLVEFFESKKINLIESGFTRVSEMYNFTYAVIDKLDVNNVKDAIKPHRALLLN
tara:strand:+ start:80 stop:313 length:234 start_codon:yes stop_codon:yes gene_type:complete